MQKIIHIQPTTTDFSQAISAACRIVDCAIAAEQEKRDRIAANRRRGLPDNNTRLLEEIAEIEKKSAQKIASDKALFEKWMSGYHASVVNSAYPRGENLKGEAVQNELAILNAGMIDRPCELEEMRNRCMNPMNPTLLRAIERYAAADGRKWPGFAFITDADKHIMLEAKLRRTAEAAFADMNCAEASDLKSITDAAAEEDLTAYAVFVNYYGVKE